jgi:hypothetical protein
VVDALARRYCDQRLSLDAIALAIGMPPNQQPVITAGVMHPFANLFFLDIKLALAVWAGDDHAFLRVQALLRGQREQTAPLNESAGGF